MSEFNTISKSTEGLYKEKGSKFVSFAFPIDSEEDIKNHLEETKKKYHDARHHCYAWVLGMENQTWRSNDDGEPSHSAGDPILGQIRSAELTNVLVIVVRYFGGTKLGVGGLINAYKTAAYESLSKAQIIKIYEKRRVIFEFEYDQMSTVERLIADFEIEVEERNFQENCKISGWIKKDRVDPFLRSTEEHYTIKITIEP